MHYQGCEVDSHWDSSPLWEGINDAAAGELIALLLESRELEVLLCSAANTQLLCRDSLSRTSKHKAWLGAASGIIVVISRMSGLSC